jgi:hypothetical protein
MQNLDTVRAVSKPWVARDCQGSSQHCRRHRVEQPRADLHPLLWHHRGEVADSPRFKVSVRSLHRRCRRAPHPPSRSHRAAARA